MINSKYIRIDNNLLLEYVYDDTNLIADSYQVGLNIKNNSYSYISGDSSSTLNSKANTLFNIDIIRNIYGIFDTSTYSFLQTKSFSSGFPIRHDTIRIHIPVNYNFLGEYTGIYVRAYAFGSDNIMTYDISNFYYDISNTSQVDILTYENPPLYYQEILWDKSISIEIPSIFVISNQKDINTGNVKLNSINYNLTKGLGLSTNTPIFIDVQFIQSKQTINSINTYILSSRKTVTFPQTPEFETIGVQIKESSNGDFFEIYGIYNGTIGDFNNYINNSILTGSRYYVQYIITIYEQNIRGKSLTITVTDDFLSPVQYRPIIQYSTTTAVIDVQMNLIDSVNNSQITRKASYGMLQDMVSKYSLYLTKINLQNANKPKIYNLKNTINSISQTVSFSGGTQVETVKVSYPVLVDKYNIIAKSSSVSIGSNLFYGIGKIMITIYPFDNIITFVIASQIDVNTINYLDLTNMGLIQMTIKNQSVIVNAPLYSESPQVNLSTGYVVFKIVSSKINDIRSIYNSGINIFYITSTQQNTTTVLYTGLFNIYDSITNVTNLNTQSALSNAQQISASASIVQNSAAKNQTGTAIVTRTIITTAATASISSGTASDGVIILTPSK